MKLVPAEVPSLALGIASIVLGSIAFVLFWLPILGILSEHADWWLVLSR